jgi:hypothetical protein
VDECGPRVGQTLAFAHYLATRPDLVPLTACARLKAAAGPLKPLDPFEVHARLDAALGPRWRIDVPDLEDTPIDIQPARQVHRALIDDVAALVIISRPWTPPLPRDDLLARLIPGTEISREVLAIALPDFMADWRYAADAEAQRGAWQMRCDSPAVPPFRVSATADLRLAAPDVLVLRLAPSGYPRQNATDTALRELVSGWFRDVLLSNPFSVQPVSEWTGRPAAWEGGVLDTLPPSCAAQLRTYLLCVAAEEPDRACGVLSGLFQQLSATGELRLARDLRQFVAARDWKWPSCRAPIPIADQVLGHWRAVSMNGARAPRHLLSFYRGLYGIASASRDLDPDGSAIADAFHEALVAVSFEKTRRLFTPEGLATSVFDLTRLATILPRAVDDGLSQGARERAEASADEAWMHAERTDLSMSVLSGVLLFVVGRHLASTGWDHSRFPLLVAAVVMFLVIVTVSFRRAKGRR